MNTVDPFAELAAKSSFPSERILNALHEEMRADSKPRRSLSRRARALLSILALALGLTLTAARVLGENPSAFLIALASSCLSIGTLLFMGVIPGTGRTNAGMRRILLGTLGIFTFTVLALNADHFMPLDQFASGGHIHGVTHCVTFSLLAGVIASSGLMMIWRRTDPFSPGLTGALLGFLGGLIGTVSVSLTCRADEGIHLTLGHGVATLILAGICWAGGRKWLTP
jgi:hypothetical protein